MFSTGSHLIAWYGFIKYHFTPLSINLLHFTEILSLVYMNSTNAFWHFPLCLHMCKQKMQYCRIKMDYIKKQDKRRCLITLEHLTLIQLKFYYCYWLEFSLFCLGGNKSAKTFCAPEKGSAVDIVWPQLFHVTPQLLTCDAVSARLCSSQPTFSKLPLCTPFYLTAPWVWRGQYMKITSFSASFLLFIL